MDISSFIYIGFVCTIVCFIIITIGKYASKYIAKENERIRLEREEIRKQQEKEDKEHEEWVKDVKFRYNVICSIIKERDDFQNTMLDAPYDNHVHFVGAEKFYFALNPEDFLRKDELPIYKERIKNGR